MITIKSTPVEWAMLMYELDDAKEHLESLINDMNSAGEIDEIDYKIQLSHIYSHLNRGWASRKQIGEIPDKKREMFSQFPKDIEPL